MKPFELGALSHDIDLITAQISSSGNMTSWASVVIDTRRHQASCLPSPLYRIHHRAPTTPHASTDLDVGTPRGDALHQ